MHERPSRVRFAVIAVSVAMAFILYLDRICLGEIVKSASFRAEMTLSKEQIGTVLGVFFLAYALCQVPSGWASDRFGARRMLTIYILGWSAMTALTGLAGGFLGLLLARLGCGMFEAGAYPTCGAVIRRWAPTSSRARASSLVTFGGRIGGALAPVLTAWMIVFFGNWRPALVIDGLVGIVIAAAWWWIVRDRPEEHPRCNAAERALLPATAHEEPPSLATLGRVLRAVCGNRSIWLSCLTQSAVNVGWAFLVTWLPTYLSDVRGVAAVEGGQMVTIVLACGMLGMLAGGPLCDWTTCLLGPRWGRVVPVVVGCLLAGSAYLGCLVSPSVWGVVACCAVVSFATDLGVPAIWAFMQDVGGRNVGTVATVIRHTGTGGDPERQTKPHAHAILAVPTAAGGLLAYAADLGIDQVLSYSLDPATATLTPATPAFVRTPPAAGPRHLALHPDGRHLYAINEYGNSITLFDRDPETGGLTMGPTVSTLPDGFVGKTFCADVKLTPDGRFLYGTNRGHDSIAIFRVAEDGRLERVAVVPSGGKGPQNLTITPDGRLLLCANMPGNSITVFRIDPTTGLLNQIGTPHAVPSPSCLLFLSPTNSPNQESSP